MAITLDVSTLSGQVRVIIGDVVTPYQIADAVIDQFLVINSNNVTKTALQCAGMLVSYYATKMNQEVGDVRVWYSERYKQYKQLHSDLQRNPSLMRTFVLPILGGTTNSEIARVNADPETPYTGISVGEFSKVSVPIRTGDFTVEE